MGPTNGRANQGWIKYFCEWEMGGKIIVSEHDLYYTKCMQQWLESSGNEQKMLLNMCAGQISAHVDGELSGHVKCE